MSSSFSILKTRLLHATALGEIVRVVRGERVCDIMEPLAATARPQRPSRRAPRWVSRSTEILLHFTRPFILLAQIDRGTLFCQTTQKHP